MSESTCQKARVKKQVLHLTSATICHHQIKLPNLRHVLVTLVEYFEENRERETDRHDGGDEKGDVHQDKIGKENLQFVILYLIVGQSQQLKCEDSHKSKYVE